MERSAAIAAELSDGIGCSKPVAASGALRIDALHSPSRQILHAVSPLWNHALLFPFAVNRSQLLFRVNQSRPPDQKPTEKVAGSVRRLSCGVKGKDTIPSGRVAVRDTTCQTVLAAGEEIPEEMFFPPLQPFRACPQSVLPSGETKGQNVFVCGKEYGS